MDRKIELQQILEKRQYFKVVCGAGNEDATEVYKIVLIYTLAGATAFDVSANYQVVKAASQAIDKAIEIAPKLNLDIKIRPFIMVSVGLKGDPHVRKAQIDRAKCIDCGMCQKVCIQEAIKVDQENKTSVISMRCIGCGDCQNACKSSAIDFYHQKKDFETLLPKCLESGAENIELHAVSLDDEAVINDWKLINKLLANNYISMCVDRKLLSNEHIINRLTQASEIARDRFIVQADGVPMSGGSDDFNTTLQTIAIADIIQKSKLPVKILASGGTNSHTGKLAKLCGVKINGVAIGTFARKIIKDYTSVDGFEDNFDKLKEAIDIAKKLIINNLEYMHD